MDRSFATGSWVGDVLMCRGQNEPVGQALGPADDEDDQGEANQNGEKDLHALRNALLHISRPLPNRALEVVRSMRRSDGPYNTRDQLRGALKNDAAGEGRTPHQRPSSVASRCSTAASIGPLRCDFDHLAPVPYQLLKIPGKHHGVDQTTKGPKWRLERHDIPHRSDARIVLKEMIMLEALEAAAHHDVPKMDRAVVFGDPSLMLVDDAEMPGTPGEFLVFPDQARCATGDCALA